MTIDLTIIIVAAATAFLIGLAKGGLGGMLGALITPLMALALPADQAVGLLLPWLIIGDIFAVTAHWRGWHRRSVLYLIPGAVIGATLATLVITDVSPETLRTVLGILVFLFVGYRLIETRIDFEFRYKPRAWHALVIGLIAGVLSGLAHSGGPPVAIYLLMQGLAPAVFVATAALFFMVLNLIKVPLYFFSGLFDKDIQLALIWVVPFIPVGVWVGKRVVQHVDKQAFDRLITVLLAISAVLLLAT